MTPCRMYDLLSSTFKSTHSLYNKNSFLSLPSLPFRWNPVNHKHNSYTLLRQCVCLRAPSFAGTSLTPAVESEAPRDSVSGHARYGSAALRVRAIGLGL